METGAQNQGVEAAADEESAGSGVKLTKEVLDRIASDSDSGNLKSKSGTPARVTEVDVEYNSSSGLSKVTSPERPNSVSLSDIYVSSDAETEKMDLEEDESRAKLAEMVTVTNGDNTNGSDVKPESGVSDAANELLPADSESKETQLIPESENVALKRRASPDESNEVENSDAPQAEAAQVFKKPRLPTELRPGFYEENGDVDADAEPEEEEDEAEDDGALESEVEDNEEDLKEQEQQEEQQEKVGSSVEPAQDTDTETDGAENGLSPMEKEKLRQDALTELTKIEVEFAQLRQNLYENRLAKLQNELQMCLDGSHPQLQTYYQKIDSIRDFKLKRMYQRQRYELECIDKETRATRTAIHQDFHRKVSDLKQKLLSNTTQKWYDINKERREMDVVVPEVNYHVPIKVANKSLSCITGYAAPANMRRPGAPLSEDMVCENIKFRYHNNPVDKLEVIVDRMRFNNELSDLDGLKRFYGGFPGAPDLGGLKDSEIHEDLTGIQQL